MPSRDADAPELVCRSDPRAQQQRRGVDRARTDHDLARVQILRLTVVPVTHPDTAVVRKQQRLDLGTGDDRQVVATGPEICVGGALTAAVLDQQVMKAGALELLAVEVRRDRMAQLPSRLDECGRDRIGGGSRARLERPAGASEPWVAVGYVLHALEQRQQLV